MYLFEEERNNLQKQLCVKAVLLGWNGHLSRMVPPRSANFSLACLADINTILYIFLVVLFWNRNYLLYFRLKYSCKQDLSITFQPGRRIRCLSPRTLLWQGRRPPLVPAHHGCIKPVKQEENPAETQNLSS